ncbi:MAG TPA: RNA polymerase sigma-70 factor [Chitinophaga sp.]|uniref:RNA polymerase sigma-70 factor n=1 Tax=Chitinophaga sp. TaxID=1869181 RepID=UPI002CC5B101|nr:RNA polymerase sigma-70 factor [Chitinophaga sp.]HVI46107.1 RNA polymerase sigma-70 factor [Chitinophaga sp.]
MSKEQSNYRIFLQSKDPVSFRQLMREYATSLHYFASGIVSNAAEAEEIVSDVFLKVWQQRDALPDCDDFKPYLFKAVKNTALNYLKKSGRRTTGRNQWEAHIKHNTGITPEEMMISKEQVQIIRKAINSLPPRCREIFTLVKEKGHSYEEVALQLGISKATVNVQMTLALKKIWNGLQLK